MYTHGRTSGCRLSLDYTYRGMRVAFMANERLRVGILLDKGADIFEFTYKPRTWIMWQSPLELRRLFVATSALPEGAFHDVYYGGWQRVCRVGRRALHGHQAGPARRGLPAALPGHRGRGLAGASASPPA